jgi:hypothetical protein
MDHGEHWFKDWVKMVLFLPLLILLIPVLIVSYILFLLWPKGFMGLAKAVKKWRRGLWRELTR